MTTGFFLKIYLQHDAIKTDIGYPIHLATYAPTHQQVERSLTIHHYYYPYVIADELLLYNRPIINSCRCKLLDYFSEFLIWCAGGANSDDNITYYHNNIIQKERSGLPVCTNSSAIF